MKPPKVPGNLGSVPGSGNCDTRSKPSSHSEHARPFEKISFFSGPSFGHLFGRALLDGSRILGKWRFEKFSSKTVQRPQNKL